MHVLFVTLQKLFFWPVYHYTCQNTSLANCKLPLLLQEKLNVDATSVLKLSFQHPFVRLRATEFHTNTVFWWIPFRWAIKISGVREITIAQVSASTTIVSRSGPMMGKGNQTRVPRKRRPILRLNLSRRGKDPGLFPSGGDTDILQSPVAPTPDFTLVFFTTHGKHFYVNLAFNALWNFSQIGTTLASKRGMKLFKQCSQSWSKSMPLFIINLHIGFMSSPQISWISVHNQDLKTTILTDPFSLYKSWNIFIFNYVCVSWIPLAMSVATSLVQNNEISFTTETIIPHKISGFQLHKFSKCILHLMRSSCLYLLLHFPSIFGL